MRVSRFLHGRPPQIEKGRAKLNRRRTPVDTHISIDSHNMACRRADRTPFVQVVENHSGKLLVFGQIRCHSADLRYTKDQGFVIWMPPTAQIFCSDRNPIASSFVPPCRPRQPVRPRSGYINQNSERVVPSSQHSRIWVNLHILLKGVKKCCAKQYDPNNGVEESVGNLHVFCRNVWMRRRSAGLRFN